VCRQLMFMFLLDQAKYMVCGSAIAMSHSGYPHAQHLTASSPYPQAPKDRPLLGSLSTTDSCSSSW
jgi:hypothetical protein